MKLLQYLVKVIFESLVLGVILAVAIYYVFRYMGWN